MLEIIYSNQFKKDFKKIRKLSILDIKKVFEVILVLEKQHKLDTIFKDHELSGQFSHFRECHIKPDLLLIYRIKDNINLELARIGSHSELFG